MLTIKSDDMLGRNTTYEAILKGKEIPKPNMPESTRVLIKELQGLAIDVEMYDENNQVIDVNTIAEDAEKESRKIHRQIVNYDIRDLERDEQERARNAYLDDESEEKESE